MGREILLCNKYPKNYISNRKTTFHSVDLKNNGLFGKEDVIANRFCKSCIKPSNQNNLFFSLCSRPFTESTLTALVNIFVGFLGAFILNYLAKRLRLQIDFAKVAFGLAGISTILMMMALNTYDRLWWVALGKLRFLSKVYIL